MSSDTSTSDSSGSRSPLDALGGFPEVLAKLGRREDLSGELCEAVIGAMLADQATPAQTGAFLVALRMKGETVEELVGMRQAMLAAAEPLDLPDTATDIVGVGGSASRRAGALNISTMASIVASAAGAVICKHGNRKASSTSGSFDLLEALGVRIDLGPDELAACVNEVGLGFAFAPRFHPSMRFVGPVRRELGVPTVFNVLGPLAHPGQPRRQVVGVADAALAPNMASVLLEAGSVRSLVVTGFDGIDEVSVTGTTDVHEVKDGGVTAWTLNPTDYGLSISTPDALVGGDAAHNARVVGEIFGGASGAVADMVSLNAGAGLVAAGVADDLGSGLQQATDALQSGAAAAKLQQLVDTTNAL